FPDVFRGQFDAARQQITEFAELAQRIQQAGAETVNVGTALGGGDQVNVTFLQQFTTVRQPVYGPVDAFGAAGHGTGKGFSRYYFIAGAGHFQVILQAVFVVPLGDGFGIGSVKADAQVRAQHRFGAQDVFQARYGKPG